MMKDIKEYEGLYAITSCGRVWSHRSKKFLKPGKDKSGYLQVTLSKNGDKETKKIHRLVMETYNPCEKMENLECDHIDFDCQNNCLKNLQWLAPEQNNKKHKACKKVLCVETGIIYKSINEAERQTGINQSSISKACRGKLKTASGYHWKFVE